MDMAFVVKLKKNPLRKDAAALIVGNINWRIVLAKNGSTVKTCQCLSAINSDN
jgi:hypothetical protein